MVHSVSSKRGWFRLISKLARVTVVQEIMNLWKVCCTSSTRINLTLHDVDGGHGKRECENETEKYSEVLQLSSGLSQDAAECSENSKNSKDSNADLTANNANVSQQKNGHVESNDRSQVHAEEEGKRETVSDLVNAWNNRTAEVLDV